MRVTRGQLRRLIREELTREGGAIEKVRGAIEKRRGGGAEKQKTKADLEKLVAEDPDKRALGSAKFGGMPPNVTADRAKQMARRKLGMPASVSAGSTTVATTTEDETYYVVLEKQ